MPPPPSPASSTCSDTTVPSTSQKRPKKNPSVKEGNEKKDEEEWNLKDVVFVEDSKNIPMGRVRINFVQFFKIYIYVYQTNFINFSFVVGSKN
jgi:hypothetical protein